ncbi:hypothetical protein DASC09_058810 [Saccharomycopsis crataegensis]|uniref:Cytochrome b5 heme-binding domain-containing protein n=1 Tax=Saccharomycopsis crataegensis TaxID=43959 RepID=A0AAV5QVT6_9ASCO|nr:hypothetical protein DASC09_058810 [Saccharomycopsis crataegensis]
MSFEPEYPVELDSPKDDSFTKTELLRYDGVNSEKIYVGVKGVVFDVSKNKKVYGPGGSYHIFAGKDSSRGLGKSSLNLEDNTTENSSKIDDFTTEESGVLDDWFTFFSKRYNIMGKMVA